MLMRKSQDRFYGRLARHERNEVEGLLDRSKDYWEMSRGLGHAPSTVTDEMAYHHLATEGEVR